MINVLTSSSEYIKDFMLNCASAFGKGAGVHMDVACPVPAQHDSSTVAPVIEHLTGQLEIHVDQMTYQIVEEGTGLGGASIDVPMNTDNSPAFVEQAACVDNPIIEHLTEQVETVTYEVLEQGTRRARTKLIDSNGYTYNVKSRTPKATYWQCTIRPKLNRCRATVVQRGDLFHRGNHAHNHCAKAGAGTAEKIATMVKQEAKSNPLKPATAIVNEVRYCRKHKIE